MIQCLVGVSNSHVAHVERLTGHMNSVGEEVCEVGNQDDQTGFCLGVASDVCELERERCDNANHDTNEQTSEEDAKENAKSLKQARDAQCLSAVLVLLRGLEKDDGNGVVEDRLAEDKGVQLRLDFVRVKDGENRNRIGG